MARSARSKRFRELENELRSLRWQLLPRRFNPTGTYAEKVFTRTVAYRVLAHAEFEEYLETRVWELALNSVKALETNGEVNRVVACLIAFSGQKLEYPPETLFPPRGTARTIWDKKLKLVEKVKSALNSLESSIKQNHGIREKDILGLLLPIGIEPAQIDTTWMSTIDSFGKLRGAVAHSSAISYRATHRPDPKNELQTVNQILLGFRDIDDGLNGLEP